MNNYLNLCRALFNSPDLGEPHVFNFSHTNHLLDEMNVDDQRQFQYMVERELKASRLSWGIAGFLERRDSLLRNLPQMVKEKRFYHLGVDIIAPVGTPLFAPVDGEVVEAGFEEGKGNYGGYVLFRHERNGSVFYSLYGHLNPESLPQKGAIIVTGEKFAEMGNFEVNGDWFHHTHLQVLTEKGYENGFVSKGYCSEEMLPVINEYCLDPLNLAT